MSTRATYKFEDTEGFDATTTIYIHYDGYPKGAAMYFWNYHHVKNRRGDAATRFIRANDLAEITLSHDAHGDTEYCYTLKGDILTARERVDNGSFMHSKSYRTWPAFFVGHYIKFIQQYGTPDLIDGFEPFYEVKLWQYSEKTTWLTLSQLREMVWAKGKEANKYSQYKGDYARLLKVLSELRQRIRAEAILDQTVALIKE